MLIPGSVWFEHVTERYFLILFHGSRSCLRCIESFTCKVSHRNSWKKTLGVLRYFKIAIKQFAFLIVSNSRDCSYQHHIVDTLFFNLWLNILGFTEHLQKSTTQDQEQIIAFRRLAEWRVIFYWCWERQSAHNGGIFSVVNYMSFCAYRTCLVCYHCHQLQNKSQS